MAVQAFIWLLMFAAQAESKRLSFLISFIDDMGYDDPSCYGNKTGQTPHVDQSATASSM